MTHALLAEHTTRHIPRSIGDARVSSKLVGKRSGIATLRTSGASKLLFPRRTDAVEAISINTSGGLTGGDRFTMTAEAGAGSRLVVTTQAAERAYRSSAGTARVRTRLTVGEGAALHWLPQEFIVFDGASVARQIDVAVAEESELVFVEPVVFGRKAMGETISLASLSDVVTLARDGVLLYRDRINLTGQVGEMLKGISVAGGASALATVLFYGRTAEAMLPIVREALPETGGASLVSPQLLCVRLIAFDSFVLRQSLVPILEHLTAQALPKSWSL